MKTILVRSFLCLFCSLVWGQQPWTVGVIFLDQDDPVVSAATDLNLFELKELQNSPHLKISTERFSKGPDLVSEMSGFLDRVFNQSTHERKLLVIYGHGLAHRGFNQLRLPQLAQALGSHHFDLLWMNSCYMANLEALVELKDVAPWVLASEFKEFVSGAPFQSLGHLPFYPEVAPAAAALLRAHLQSYSKIKLGQQADQVEKSSASLTLVQTSLLDGLVKSIHEWVLGAEKLSQRERELLNRRRALRRLGDPSLNDLGALFRDLAELRPADQQINAILKQLSFDQPWAQAQQKINLINPQPQGAWMLFGFEQWTRGHKGDSSWLEFLPKNLKPMNFIPGPMGYSWPALWVQGVSVELDPFPVGAKRFDVLFVDPQRFQPLAPGTSFVRLQDFMLRRNGNPHNPIRYLGATFGVLQRLNEFSGLNVFDPSLGSHDLDYYDLKFDQQSGWSRLFR